MKPLITTCLLLLLATVHTYSQKVSMQKVEKELVTAYRKITDERDSKEVNYDSLINYNHAFAKKLSKYISEVEPSLNYRFDSLKRAGVDLVTSDDGLFRIYSWDTWQGGSMHDYETAFQYKFKGKVYADAVTDSEDNGFGVYYSQIFTLKASGKTYYLAVWNFRLSSKYSAQGIEAYSMENAKLNDSVRIFKTNSGLVNSISFEFDFFSVVDRPERPLKLIKYDAKKKILYIPIVHEDGKVTNKFITYRFNGKYFEKMKV